MANRKADTHDATNRVLEPNQRIYAHADWYYLVKEYYELYRYLPSGGSARIRGHQRRVRSILRTALKSNVELRLQHPVDQPVTSHLRRVLDQGREFAHASHIRAIDAVRNELSWQYGYKKGPRRLRQRYAYTEIVGPSGPVVLDNLILGLVLFAPGCDYPSHAHEEITESYVCLSGSISQNDQAVYAPGSLIFNPPGHLHRITVSDREPSLLAYAWEGPPEKLLHQEMHFTRTDPI